jgi:hypothetical protein
MKLTRGGLIKDADWNEWQTSEYTQLDQYDAQGMFGEPVYVSDNKGAIFNLVWTYVIKELDKRKKARCTCDGSTRAGQVRVLDHTYANCVDQTGSRLFYAIATGENMMVFGADVSVLIKPSVNGGRITSIALRSLKDMSSLSNPQCKAIQNLLVFGKNTRILFYASVALPLLYMNHASTPVSSTTNGCCSNVRWTTLPLLLRQRQLLTFCSI